ncbi:hypothetical protein MUY27_20145 [Mucilaginibacter sp. RS28]|uniref:Uncharacterized protein n=1 Tax=Mucilaginibacter straminoryzae TaxID=2932774 RepID=A0A9X2BAM3_9SPHI|nr:hypothetical protein [Mucilaginibacter straminoryzae]MCJ8212039.1 hypothetical protein [Mucilaginibacter straminoryzae]
MKKYLLIAPLLLLFKVSIAQSFFSTQTYANAPQGVGANSIFGWGENFDRTIDVRPNPHPWMGTMMINYHTGLTLSAHSVYGGIRFYNQGYPNPYDSSTGAKMVMSITNGKVGIGTTDPDYALTVNGNFKVTNENNFLFYNGFADIYFKYSGRGSGGRAMVHGDGNMLVLNFGGDFTGGTRLGTNAYFTEDNNGTSYVYSGKFGIGTADTKGYKLAVNGSAIATSVTVKNFDQWPDYVFKPSYKLPSLSSISTYISQNRHLPDMPSESEVKAKGIDLGEMVKLQTKKIEELTLYLIEKDKEVKAQQVQIEKLQRQINQNQQSQINELRKQLLLLKSKVK